MSNETNAASASHGDASGSPPANVATSVSHGDQSSPAASLEELQRQLAALQSKNAEIFEDNQKYRRRQKEQEEAAQAAEQQRLKEQGEFKQLAERAETRVKELEPIAERYAKLAELEHARITALVKDWPEEVKKLVPGKDTDAEQRLARVEELRPLVDKLTQQRTPAPGNRAGPPAVGNPGDMNRDVAKTELLKSGLYKGF